MKKKKKTVPVKRRHCKFFTNVDSGRTFDVFDIPLFETNLSRELVIWYNETVCPYTPTLSPVTVSIHVKMLTSVVRTLYHFRENQFFI